MESKPDLKKSLLNPFALLLTFCAISAIFIYLVYSGNFVFGSASGGWAYPDKPWIASIPKWIPLVTLLFVAVMIFLGSKTIEKHEKLTLLGCLVLSIAIQIFISSIVYNTLGDIILSHDANSFYAAAQQYSPTQLLAQFQSTTSALPGHASSNMPGKVLFFHLLFLLTQNPQVMGYLIIAVSSLGGVLLYGVCKRLFEDRLVGLYALVLYALIPCKQEFFPILNSVTPIFILLSLYLFMTYLGSKRKWLLVLFGVSLYMLIMFEPSPLVLGFVFLGILVDRFAQKKMTLKELGSIFLFAGLSFLAVYFLVWAVFSFNLFQAFVNMLKDAASFNSVAGRPYSIWIKENLKEFFYGAGLPVMMIFVFYLFSILGDLKSVFKKGSVWAVENVTFLSLLITFGFVLILGINRGEVTRLWIYLAVFFQIPAAYFMVKVVKNHWAFLIFAATLVTQTLVSLQHVVFIVK